MTTTEYELALVGGWQRAMEHLLTKHGYIAAASKRSLEIGGVFPQIESPRTHTGKTFHVIGETTYEDSLLQASEVEALLGCEVVRPPRWPFYYKIVVAAK
jgi:hypothetical protein